MSDDNDSDGDQKGGGSKRQLSPSYRPPLAKKEKASSLDARAVASFSSEERELDDDRRLRLEFIVRLINVAEKKKLRNKNSQTAEEIVQIALEHMTEKERDVYGLRKFWSSRDALKKNAYVQVWQRAVKDASMKNSDHKCKGSKLLDMRIVSELHLLTLEAEEVLYNHPWASFLVWLREGFDAEDSEPQRLPKDTIKLLLKSAFSSEEKIRTNLFDIAFVRDQELAHHVTITFKPEIYQQNGGKYEPHVQYPFYIYGKFREYPDSMTGAMDIQKLSQNKEYDRLLAQVKNMFFAPKHFTYMGPEWAFKRHCHEKCERLFENAWIFWGEQKAHKYKKPYFVILLEESQIEQLEGSGYEHKAHSFFVFGKAHTVLVNEALHKSKLVLKYADGEKEMKRFNASLDALKANNFERFKELCELQYQSIDPSQASESGEAMTDDECAIVKVTRVDDPVASVVLSDSDQKDGEEDSDSD